MRRSRRALRSPGRRPCATAVPRAGDFVLLCLVRRSVDADDTWGFYLVRYPLFGIAAPRMEGTPGLQLHMRFPPLILLSDCDMPCAQVAGREISYAGARCQDQRAVSSVPSSVLATSFPTKFEGLCSKSSTSGCCRRPRGSRASRMWGERISHSLPRSERPCALVPSHPR